MAGEPDREEGGRREHQVLDRVDRLARHADALRQLGLGQAQPLPLLPQPVQEAGLHVAVETRSATPKAISAELMPTAMTIWIASRGP